MQRVTANCDGSIGPFGDTDAAEQWLAARLAFLCTLTGQKGTPTAHILDVDTGGPCLCPAVYDSSTDTVRMHYTPSEEDVFDVAAVDGMLLHALGHRARRAQAKILRWFGWTLAAAALAFAAITAFRDDPARDHPTPPLLMSIAVLAALGLLHSAALARAHWRAETDADDYALRHGGPRPILTFLRRMSGDPVSESAIPRARPARRIARLQTRFWGDSTLVTDEPSLPPIADPTTTDDQM
ncbi:hypothetical protein AB4Z09_27045 [Rhodococcus sp. TAF43]|uniref:hypothetical protein n=1 Tax=Rhodococcus sp. TAF43 TaxID=3237483 RepID=UPI003F9BA784